jgi:outer membrane protein OmpA-like peptidoglycan-associated protein
VSLLKKIILLLIFFLILNIFSIYEFDYKNFLSNNPPISLSKNVKEETSIFDKVFDLSNYKEETKPFNLVLIKKDGIVEMNGLFANTDDAKKVSDILNINREGEYKYEENRVIDEYLLDQLTILITPFKDFFADNSKLTVIDNEVVLSGALKDANYKDLLDSILSSVKIDLKTDIFVPEMVTLDNIKKSINENSTEIKEVKEANPLVLEKVENKEALVSANSSSKLNELQSEINNLLSSKKINFERRSSKITDDSNIVVEEIAKILNDNATFKIEVSGHTDSRGSESLNKSISQNRASSVRDVLISLGIDKDRVNAVGYGEEFPIVKDDENGLSEINRRVEFNILGE